MTHFARHCKAFQKHLKKLKVDAYWVNFVPDLFYIAGYASEGCWGLVGPNYAVMLVPGLALDQANAIAKHIDVRSVKKASDAYAALVDIVLKHKAKSIGYDPYRTSEAYINGLRKHSGNRLKWVPITAATTPLRIKKDPEEVKALREAGRLVARGFDHIKKIARPGMRECDLAAEF